MEKQQEGAQVTSLGITQVDVSPRLLEEGARPDPQEASEFVEVPLEVFVGLPKTDLHVHLDGSLRPATLLDLARKQRVSVPADTPEGIENAIGAGQNFGSLVNTCAASSSRSASCRPKMPWSAPPMS